MAQEACTLFMGQKVSKVCAINVPLLKTVQSTYQRQSGSTCYITIIPDGSQDRSCVRTLDLFEATYCLLVITIADEMDSLVYICCVILLIPWWQLIIFG